MRLKRKIINNLVEWKENHKNNCLLIIGARQVGKTYIIQKFAEEYYEKSIYINFIDNPDYKNIFSGNLDIETIIKQLTLRVPNSSIIPGKTLLILDEIQVCENAITALKFIAQEKNIDCIASSHFLGISYKRVSSFPVGYIERLEMHSLDFEEFLWAKGYNNEQIEDMYQCMIKNEPLSKIQYDVMMENFQEYMIIGGMPLIVKTFIENKTYTGILEMQKQIILDYEEDITKYAGGLDKTKILSAYRKIPVFLGNENKKFQITKISAGARNREYIGVIEWLKNAGIVNICYCLDQVSLPLKGNYNPDNYRLYFGDPGLLIATLDEEAQLDLRKDKNFNTYKGAVYENIVGDMLVKEGYDLYFYRDETGRLEMDFFVRDANSLIPVEVKANDNSTISLNNLIDNNKYKDIKYGIKLCNKNIGFNGKFYTFPYFLAFLLKRYLKEK